MIKFVTKKQKKLLSIRVFMSLDNIQLPPFIIHDLFKDCLVDLNSYESIPQGMNTKALPFLGSNKQNIIILINNPDISYLSNQQLNFLTGILAACKLNLADIAILNLHKRPAINYNTINDELSPRITLMFGVSPMSIGLPFDIPMFQVQQFNERTYMVAPTLQELGNNKELKRQLWVNLQQIFSI